MAKKKFYIGKTKGYSYLECTIERYSEENTVGVKLPKRAKIMIGKTTPHRDFDIMHEYSHLMVHVAMLNSSYSYEYFTNLKWGYQRVVDWCELMAWKLTREMLNLKDNTELYNYAIDSVATYGISPTRFLEFMDREISWSKNDIWHEYEKIK